MMAEQSAPIEMDVHMLHEPRLSTGRVEQSDQKAYFCIGPLVSLFHSPGLTGTSIRFDDLKKDSDGLESVNNGNRQGVLGIAAEMTIFAADSV